MTLSLFIFGGGDTPGVFIDKSNYVSEPGEKEFGFLFRPC